VSSLVRVLGWCTLLALLLFVVGCAAGNPMYVDKPAGFWAGLWHGAICVVTFIISLFSDRVGMYETANSGGWYDFGFLLGAAIVWGGGHRARRKRIKVVRSKDREWEEIAAKVEEKVRRGIRKWVEESGEGDKEWEEIGKKVEERIKRELRNWADR
jgi:hypothetical protein